MDPSLPATQESTASLQAPALVLADGQLSLPGRDAPLPCTLAGGPGKVFAIERVPGGTTFIAAERGVFTWGPGAEALDQIDTWDGFPRGVPVGLLRAEENRLWIATEEQLGCVDPRQGFGRCLGPEDGVPPGPYGGLSMEGTTLVLETPEGPFRHTPGVDPAPRISAIHVNGTPYELGTPVEIAHGSPLALEARGVASGGASFRFRMEGQHLWRPLADSRDALSDLEPGRHSIAVCAFDRDLRRSAPWIVEIGVQYPPMLDTNRLPLFVVGGCAALLLLFLVCARSQGGGWMRYRRAGIACWLLILVTGQVLVGLVFPHGRSWPFVGFTMYTQSTGANTAVHRQKLLIERVDGMRRELPSLRGVLDIAQLHQALIPVAQGTEQDKEAFLQLLNEHLEATYTGFLILDQRVRLTPDGPVPIAPIVHCAWPPERF